MGLALVLAIPPAISWLFDADPGITNVLIHVAISVTLLGAAVWTVRHSGLPRGLKWLVAATPCALLAAFYAQLLPIKTLNNGDGVIVGWVWRWEQPDSKLGVSVSAPQAPIRWIETAFDYPRFLGKRHWAEAPGVRLETDWRRHPPKLLWKQPIGAGWSSFAVVGGHAVTQEQRGDRELVACYEVRTGRCVWTHADEVRWDPSGRGALGEVGPRATPTVHQGKVFAYGATGILNCLEAATGKLLWSHRTLEENSAENATWGKSNSPLIVDDRVLVSVGGPGGRSLVAYDIDTGRKAWSAGQRRSSYASPVLAELGGVRQILCVNEDYLTAHDAAVGDVLWEHPWPGNSGSDASCSQPVPVGGDRVFLSKGYGVGAELVQVRRDSAGAFSTETLWKNSSVMRTKMANVVVHGEHVYGLNDGMLQCIDLQTGRSRWKKRRSPKFGHGQILLVDDILLALTELGELVLVAASPDKYQELAHLSALEGVTWNNPALAGSMLLIRNANEASCYELSLRQQPPLGGGG